MKLVVHVYNMCEQGKESCTAFVPSHLHFACKKNKTITQVTEILIPAIWGFMAYTLLPLQSGWGLVLVL